MAKKRTSKAGAPKEAADAAAEADARPPSGAAGPATTAPSSKTRKTGTPPAPPKGTPSASSWSAREKAVVALAVVPLVAIALYKSAASNPLTYIDVTDEATLRRVFFSGEVWAVACATKDGAPPASFEPVAARLRDEMRFGVLDCAAKLPGSGRTTLQRWKLKGNPASDKPSAPPVLFVANGVQVAQIAASATRSEYDLVRELRLAAIRRPVDVASPDAFADKCLAKPRCLAILRGSAEELEPAASKALDALAGEFGALKDAGGVGQQPITFAALDASQWKLSFEGFDLGDAVKLRRFEPGAHRAVFFRNVSSNELYALAHFKGGGGLSEPALRAFLGGLGDDDGTAPSPRLVRLPDGGDGQHDAVTIVRRPKPKRARPAKPADEASAGRPGDDPGGDKAAGGTSSSSPPETLSPEERERLLREQRDRETKAREQMDQQAADSAYVAEADDVLDLDAGDDDDDAPDEAGEEEDVEEI